MSTYVYTVDGERFTGLNICGFSAIEVFTEILLRCLGHSTHYLVQLKRGAFIHRKTFAVATPENCEKCESFAQQIFPCLRYVCIIKYNSIMNHASGS